MREKIAVVNDNDEIIGEKFRDELTYSDIHRIVSIWIENSQGKVLLAQRAFHKELHPGLWGPAAAGAVSFGETYEQAAYKEMSEEIGLTDTALDFVDKTAFMPDKEKRFICWYKGICDKPAREFLLEKDVAQVQWFSKETLAKELKLNPSKFVPSNILWKKLSFV